MIYSNLHGPCYTFNINGTDPSYHIKWGPKPSKHGCVRPRPKRRYLDWITGEFVLPDYADPRKVYGPFTQELVPLLRGLHHDLWNKVWLQNQPTCTFQDEDRFGLRGTASDSRVLQLRCEHLQAASDRNIRMALHRRANYRMAHPEIFDEPQIPESRELSSPLHNVDIVFRIQPGKTKCTVTKVDAMAQVIVDIHKHLSPFIESMKQQGTRVTFYTLTPHKHTNPFSMETSHEAPDPAWLLELQRLLNNLQNGQVPRRPWNEKPKSERAWAWCRRGVVRYCGPCVECGLLCLKVFAYVIFALCVCVWENTVRLVKEKNRRRKEGAKMRNTQRDGVDTTGVSDGV
jgi:hypothetical protein